MYFTTGLVRVSATPRCLVCQVRQRVCANQPTKTRRGPQTTTLSTSPGTRPHPCPRLHPTVPLSKPYFSLQRPSALPSQTKPILILHPPKALGRRARLLTQAQRCCRTIPISLIGLSASSRLEEAPLKLASNNGF